MDDFSKILDSWKEIAAFLKRGVRTVQRWERTEGLPVRRHQHLKRGSVYALPSELARWQDGRTGKIPRHSSRNSNAEAVNTRSLAEQLHLLQSLTLRQRLLATELKGLLAMQTRLEQFYGPAGFEEVAQWASPNQT